MPVTAELASICSGLADEEIEGGTAPGPFVAHQRRGGTPH
jgi:hypothetical protein